MTILFECLRMKSVFTEEIEVVSEINGDIIIIFPQNVKFDHKEILLFYSKKNVYCFTKFPFAVFPQNSILKV